MDAIKLIEMNIEACEEMIAEGNYKGACLPKWLHSRDAMEGFYHGLKWSLDALRDSASPGVDPAIQIADALQSINEKLDKLVSKPTPIDIEVSKEGLINRLSNQDVAARRAR